MALKPYPFGDMLKEELRGREIMKIKSWPLLIVLVAAIALMLAGCGFRGTSYLALDYTTFEPITVYFPELPDPFVWGAYYEHPDGTYYGEYTNWDILHIGLQLYTFNYTIEVNRGFFFGSVGSDRYYTMLLDPGGPVLHFFDVSAALTGKASSEHNKSISNRPIDTSQFDMAHPEPFSYERSSNGVTFRVTGNRYPKK
jgi:hypothetical protein